MRRPARVVVASLACLAACRAPDIAISAQSVAGCWTVARRDGLSEPLTRMPDQLVLDTLPNLDPDGRPHPYYPLRLGVGRRPGAWSRRGRPDLATRGNLPLAWSAYYALMAWRFRAPDSVTVALHANMSLSWHVDLRPHGDSLLGEAHAYSDYDGDARTIPVVAHRAACPAEPEGEEG